ncbi:hypothetical protein [Notoacmeibacter ruber]|uniref:DUF2946 domain-containing protein n=1 Tax=Notoacmeibacter ruber TaxID=2670375 RepID=A0A3L7J918_9HYPH|nr:hypothetical protein [Notoacmeibacter ruber]RLQ86865.1 hypothetical protein D8780_00250 [Notoacmeibacter ruber]
MRRRTRTAPRTRAFLAACLAAVMVLALGMGSVVRAASLEAALYGPDRLTADYRLPDGSWPVLCDGDAEHSPDHGKTVEHCFLCTFAKIAGLPPLPSDVAEPCFRPLAERAITASAPVLPPSPSLFLARAPPSFV